ncbi:hypothetical protein Glove_522g36 [Diversispora epigaea]|uniref:Uncharacterized protein n=1 Tax=Diversispora epigaea TaxID=1348612 RepID=A0A397GEA6_9GLOM|nr:hypothetical protein Glove_522g36 [Diversispora epigaea]
MRLPCHVNTCLQSKISLDLENHTKETQWNHSKSVILPARSILIQELPVLSKVHFSTIISDEHAAEISSWIDHRTTTYSSTNHPYEFQLILR